MSHVKIICDPAQLPVIVCTVTLRREPTLDEWKAFQRGWHHLHCALGDRPGQKIFREETQQVVLGRDQLTLCFDIPEELTKTGVVSVVDTLPEAVTVQDVPFVYECPLCDAYASSFAELSHAAGCPSVLIEGDR